MTDWLTQRNDVHDAYGTYPIAQRPYNGPKDAFSDGVQHTQWVINRLASPVSDLFVYQRTHRHWIKRPCSKVQRWNHDGGRQPRYAPKLSNTLIDPWPIRPASYGSLARFKDVQRLHPVGQNTVIGAGGDMSDFQYIQSILDELVVDEFTAADGHDLGPSEIHEYLSQVMYARRSKMNPLWNSLIVGGVSGGKKWVPAPLRYVTHVT